MTDFVVDWSKNRWMLLVLLLVLTVVVFLLLVEVQSEAGDVSSAESMSIVTRTRGGPHGPKYTVGFETYPVGLNLTIDGINYTTPVEFVWVKSETHNISAPAIQYQGNLSPYFWDCWSDGGGQAHAITVTGHMTITAYYVEGSEITVTTDPLLNEVEVDGVLYAPPASFLWPNGSVHEIGAPSWQFTPNGTYLFEQWIDGGLQYRWIWVEGTKTYTAHYEAMYEVTIDTEPSSMTVFVDGCFFATPITILWGADIMHDIRALERIDEGWNVSWRYSHWSDGGEISHPITVTKTERIVAFYDKYYRTEIGTRPTGLKISADGKTYGSAVAFWWKEGSQHEVEAISPQEHGGTRYIFLRWQDGASTPKRTILVDGPITYRALYMPRISLLAILPDPPIVEGPVIGTGWSGEISCAEPVLPMSMVRSEYKWMT